jgi:hypothetical protein
MNVDYNKSITNDEAHETRRSNHGHGRCEVNGCPRWGQVHTDGRWNCRYHYRIAGSKLGHVTLMLTSHAVEVNWLETLMVGTADVEWSCENLKASAPRGLEANPGEKFRDYKLRIEAHINNLLYGPKVRQLTHDNKMAAAGDDSFGNIGDHLPSF